MATKVRPYHINKYLSETDDYNVDSINDATDDGIIFEALCETIVSQNDNSSIDSLFEEFSQQSNLNVRDFAEQKFDNFVHEETISLIGESKREKWIEYTILGIEEKDALQQ